MTAIRVEHGHRFGVPVADGFDYITDPENWPAFWPGLVRIEPGSQWREPGDEMRLLVKLLGRQVELHMRLATLERNRLVEYTSVQRGLPAARHERHFSGAGDGFDYRLVVEYRPRDRLKGLYDRVLVRRGIERALRATVENLQSALHARWLNKERRGREADAFRGSSHDRSPRERIPVLRTTLG